MLLIEKRLLSQGVASGPIVLGIQGYINTLAREGIQVVPLSVEVRDHLSESIGVHQGGVTLMAIRALLTRLYACGAGTTVPITGAILMGRFPEGRIARRFLLQGDLEVQKVAVLEELVSDNSDVMLADLDGAWPALYRSRVTLFPRDEFTLAAGAPASGGSYRYEARTTAPGQSVVDVFFLDDGRASANPASDATRDANNTAQSGTVSLSRQASAELSAGDAASARMFARPEIQISRINPYAIARRPNTPWVNALGEPVTFDVSQLRSKGNGGSPDFTQERTLLLEYLSRNIQYRLGNSRHVFGASAFVGADKLGHAVDHFNALKKIAPSEMVDGSGGAARFEGSNSVHLGTEADLYSWILAPQLFKSFTAHSKAYYSGLIQVRADQFGSNPFGYKYFFWKPEQVDVTTSSMSVDAQTGRSVTRQETSKVWRYTPRQDSLETNNLAQGPFCEDCREGEPGKTDNFWDHYSRWFSKFSLQTNPDAVFYPHIYFHGGCNANSPTTVSTTNIFVSSSLHTELFGFSRPANNFLFLANGLAVFARSKTYFDFIEYRTADVLQSRTARLGDAWIAYFERLSVNEAGNRPVHYNTLAAGPSVSDKRPYFWGIAGDYSLPVRPAAVRLSCAGGG